MSIWKWFLGWGQPATFYARSTRALPWLAVASVLGLLVGGFWSLWWAPADYQQGDVFRIIYVHVPAAWLSLAIYLGMLGLALLVFVWEVKLAGWGLRAAAILGAVYTLMALITGAIWGQPMWGTWWVWDARLTSELILLFVYLGIVLVFEVIQNRLQAMKVAAGLTFVGSVNLPIIHYSVIWWHTLHQPPSIRQFESAMDPSMLLPLLWMAVVFKLFFLWQWGLMVRCALLKQAQTTPWLARRLLALSANKKGVS